MLRRLLEALAAQDDDGSFAAEIVVVDNDSDRSAEATVRDVRNRTGIEIRYDCEPERNISLTRNRALRHATGNLIAFIDDDECPVRDWLVQLYRTLRTHGTDGVLGPVLPEFPSDAPAWLQKGRFFHRRRLATGTRISVGDGRTGNLLLRRSIFLAGDDWFNPAFGRTGGEDSDFFRRLFSLGYTFVWCDEAVVHETVPPERWRPSYHIKRLLRSGTQDGEWMRAGQLPSRGLIARNTAILGACAMLAPFSLLFGKRISTTVLQKLAYCGGVITGYYGMPLSRERD
jgi:cellulose synthase/poly-beta-1,6-N-acetylglucosamine synthase-like glycosyltransferase